MPITGLRSRTAPFIVHGRLCELAARRFPWLYLVTDTSTPDRQARFLRNDREPFYQHIYKCLEGGVDIVQYRDKTASDAEFMETAKRIQAITKRFDVPFVINDRVDVALELGAWVHVGRKDWPADKLKDLRAAFDDKKLRQCAIGYSIDADNLNEAPYSQDADMYGVGPIFATKTKTDAAKPMGLEGLEVALRNAQGDPIVAIGGITRDNVVDVMKCGAAGVCLIGELMDSKTPTDTARELKEMMVKSASGNVPKESPGRSITEILNQRRNNSRVGRPGTDKHPEQKPTRNI